MDPVNSEISLERLVEEFQIVEASDGYVIATPPIVQAADPAPSFSELGYSGETAWSWFNREDYNSDLLGLHGLRQYDKMRRQDSSVRASLRMIKTPILAADWFIEAASDKREHEMHARFTRKALFEWPSTTWNQTIVEALNMLDFGYYMFEKVYETRTWERNRQVVTYKKLAPRHPMDVLEFHWDAHGGLSSVEFASIDGVGSYIIPIEKLAMFTFDKEGNDPRGISMLRSSYKNWYMKENAYKIDAIQKERHSIGIPVIVLPPGFSPQDKAKADELGRNLRTNEKAHVVLPPMWDLHFARLEGQPVSALETAEHHARMTFQNILGDFLYESSGNAAEVGEKIFMRSTRYIADTIRDVFNSYMIPQLIDFNFETDEYPKLRVRRIGDMQDRRQLSFILRNLVGAKVIVPDEKLEVWARQEIDAPMPDPDTARDPKTGEATGGTPQPPKVGLPRQSQAANMRIGPGNEGQDESGTSGTR